MRSPLMIGSELTKLDPITLDLLTNSRGLAAHRDGFGAHPLRTSEEESVWVSSRAGTGERYAALFNLSDQPRKVAVHTELLQTGARCARELWSGLEQPLGPELSAELQPHDAVIFLLTSGTGGEAGV